MKVGGHYHPMVAIGRIAQPFHDGLIGDFRVIKDDGRIRANAEVADDQSAVQSQFTGCSIRMTPEVGFSTLNWGVASNMAGAMLEMALRDPPTK